uniref:AT-rich interactive domain-containing protein 2 n=1 Tax=Anthurium amnicola TaxID=1678845 RepID=A0A1D1XPN2_9ARAE
MLQVRNLTHVCLPEFRAHRKWRHHAASASAVDGKKRVRLVLTRTGARVRRRHPPSPAPVDTVRVGVEEDAAVVDPWVVPIPMVGTPLWRDGRATDAVDPHSIVQRLPPPFEPPASPINGVLEEELRLLFDQMSRSGDVVYRFRAGSAPGSEHIECCDVLTEWALRLLKRCAGDVEWRLRIERLVYKVLFEYIMKLHFRGNCENGGRTGGPVDVGQLMNVHSRKPEEEPLLRMLAWLKAVARNPCGPLMSGTVQEWQNVNFTDQQTSMPNWPVGLNLNEPPCEVRPNVPPFQDDAIFLRNMVICARKALFMRINDVLTIEDFPYRTCKKQKVYPYLCEASTASISPHNMGSSFINQSTLADCLAPSGGMLKQPQRRPPRALELLKFSDSQRKKRVPIGPAFQADIPEWKGPSPETLVSDDDEDSNDSRRSGTQIWPMKGDFQETTMQTTGKGKLNFCACPRPGSVSCVRYHISKSRLRLKWIFGEAFNSLGFDDMGEEVSNSWTLDEQRIFDALVKLNPLAENKSFWGPALKIFGSKNSRDIVSYYFNVFILRRMGIQTRLIGEAGDSDDDEFNVDAYEDLYPRVLHRRVFRRNP